MTQNQLKWLELQEQQRAHRVQEEETMRSNLANESIKEYSSFTKAMNDAVGNFVKAGLGVLGSWKTLS